MTYRSTVQAFYGADNPEELELVIDENKVQIWDGFGECLAMDRIAARMLAQAILRELDKQS